MNNRLIIFTGAGVSAESGLATFRDKGGIWEQFDVSEVCNIHSFKAAKNFPEKRAKIFEFYNLLKTSVKDVEPNLAHKQIAKWQEQFKNRVTLITTNIDDLLEKAGCKDVLHVHGNSYEMHCTACGTHWYVGDSLYDHEERCPKCNSRLTKPAIIFFGEQAPLYADMHRTLKPQDNDIVIVIGASLQVIDSYTILPPARNRHSILINKEPTEQDSRFDYVLHGNATELVPKLDEIIQKIMNNEV